MDRVKRIKRFADIPVPDEPVEKVIEETIEEFVDPDGTPLTPPDPFKPFSSVSPLGQQSQRPPAQKAENRGIGPEKYLQQPAGRHGYMK